MWWPIEHHNGASSATFRDVLAFTREISHIGGMSQFHPVLAMIREAIDIRGVGPFSREFGIPRSTIYCFLRQDQDATSFKVLHRLADAAERVVNEARPDSVPQPHSPKRRADARQGVE